MNDFTWKTIFLIVIFLFLFISYFKNNKKRNEIIKSGLLLEQKVQNEIEKLSIGKYKIISNVIIKIIEINKNLTI